MTTITKEEFEIASAAECRQFFAVLKGVQATWHGPTTGGSPGRNLDLIAQKAARIQLTDHGPLLLDRMRTGELVVVGMKR